MIVRICNGEEERSDLEEISYSLRSIGVKDDACSEATSSYAFCSASECSVSADARHDNDRRLDICMQRALVLWRSRRRRTPRFRYRLSFSNKTRGSGS